MVPRWILEGTLLAFRKKELVAVVNLSNPKNCLLLLLFRYHEIIDREKKVGRIKSEHVLHLKSIMSKEDPRHVNIIIIEVNLYVSKDHILHIPAEIALTVFNVHQGILDNFCSFVDPCKFHYRFYFILREFLAKKH